LSGGKLQFTLCHFQPAQRLAAISRSDVVKMQHFTDITKTIGPAFEGGADK
jgi:hypothetical protein